MLETRTGANVVHTSTNSKKTVIYEVGAEPIIGRITVEENHAARSTGERGHDRWYTDIELDVLKNIRGEPAQAFKQCDRYNWRYNRTLRSYQGDTYDMVNEILDQLLNRTEFDDAWLIQAGFYLNSKSLSIV